MFLVVACLPGVLHAAVSASLDRTVIYPGDTTTLHITTSGDDEGKQPDLSPLRKDFEILGTSSSSQIQIINGQRSDKHEWLIELAPTRKGSFTIPALSVGSSQTVPLTLEVKEQPAAMTAQAGQPIFIRSEISPAQGNTYIQQQLLYTTRLYYRVPLIEGSFSDPKIDNAAIERLGDDKQYNTTIDGQSYQVVERRYAVFPEQSGKLTINPMVFSGRTVSATNRQSVFGRADSLFEQMLNQSGFNDRFFKGTPFGDPGKRVRLASNTLSVDIKPRPASDNSKHWLPTSKLVLQDSWAKTPPVIHAGEPVTRSIILEAEGLEAAQLPEIKPPATDSLRVYPERPELTNKTDGNGIIGRSEQRFAYVASQPGKLHFPAVSVSWWDTHNNQQQTTVLPAYDVTVLPGTGQATAAPSTTEAMTKPATAIAPAGNTSAPDTTPATSTSTAPGKSLYWQLATGLVVIVFIVVTWLLLRRRHKPNTVAPQAAQSTSAPPAQAMQSDRKDTLANLRQSLRDACANSDPHAAAKALLAWAAATWPQQAPRSLGALASRVDHGADLIRELESALYGAKDQKWHGLPLWKAFADGLLQNEKAATARQQPEGAPPLYPDWHKQAG